MVSPMGVMSKRVTWLAGEHDGRALDSMGQHLHLSEISMVYISRRESKWFFNAEWTVEDSERSCP